MEQAKWSFIRIGPKLAAAWDEEHGLDEWKQNEPRARERY